MQNRIKELRKQKGVTMKQLGAALGLAESTISQYETGKREPNFKTLLRISDYFGVRIEDIVGLETFDSGDDFTAAWEKCTQDATNQQIEIHYYANREKQVIDHQMRRLISIYERLDPDDQCQLIKFGEFLVSQPKYEEMPHQR